MITIISSAKTMDITPINKHKVYSPYFLRETQVLLNECKAFDQEKLMYLMSINKKLAELTYQRFQEYDNTIAKPALFAYDGDVFKQLNKLEYSIDNLDFIQDHLCIISGLYGLLKPLDLIVPYRLEMAVNLHTDKIQSLYNFWSAKATKYLNDLLAEHKVKYLINLASAEYSKIIDLTILNFPMISIVFKQIRNGKIVNLGILAKKARGRMLDNIIINNIDNIEDLKMFNLDGYLYNSSLSDDNNIVFLMDTINL